jgi:hypothetical protein
MRTGHRKLLTVSVLLLFLTLSSSSLFLQQDGSSTTWDLSNEEFPLKGRSLVPSTAYIINATDLPFEKRLLLVSLQGIVNKDQPLMFINYGSSQDTVWSSWLRSYAPNMSIIALDFDEALTLFLDRAKGCVIYDKDMGGSIGVASSISGLMDAIMVEKGMDDRGLAHLYDATVNNGTNTDPLQFYETFIGAANRTVLSNVVPSDIETRDFFIQNKILTLDLSAGPFMVDEDQVFSNIFDKFAKGSNGRNRVVMGFFERGFESSEDFIIQEFSKRGIIFVPSGRTPNLSFLSYFPSIDSHIDRPHDGGGVPVLQSKVYVTFGMPDGDNLNFDYTLMDGHWGQETWLQDVPVSWSISPALKTFCPFYYDYFEENLRPNDTLMDSPSGLGVIFPGLYPRDMLDKYLQSSSYRSTNNVWLVNTYNPYEIRYSDSVLQAYAERSKGIVLDYGDMPERTPFWKEDDAVVIRATHFWTDLNNLKAKLEIQKSSSDGPYFIFVALYPWHFDKDAFVEFYKELRKDPNLEIVNGTHFFDLARAAIGPSGGDPPQGYMLFRDWTGGTSVHVEMWVLVTVAIAIGIACLIGHLFRRSPRWGSTMGKDDVELGLATTLFLVGILKVIFSNYWDWTFFLLALPMVLILFLLRRRFKWIFSQGTGFILLVLTVPLVFITNLMAPVMIVGFFLIWKDRTVGVVRTIPLALVLTVLISIGHQQLLATVLAGLLMVSRMVSFIKGQAKAERTTERPALLVQLMVPSLLLPLFLPEMFVFNARTDFSATSSMMTVLLLPALVIMSFGMVNAWMPQGEWSPKRKFRFLLAVFTMFLISGSALAFLDMKGVSIFSLYAFYFLGYMFMNGYNWSMKGRTKKHGPLTLFTSFFFLFGILLFIVWAIINPVVFPVYTGITSYEGALILYQKLGLIFLATSLIAMALLVNYYLIHIRKGRFSSGD